MNRGAPLKRTPFAPRSKPMKRTWMKKKPARRIAARRALRPYLALVAQMPCAGELGISISGRGWRDHRCSGPIQVMHIGPKPGMGMKCPDDETGPGCLQLHTDFDQHRGPFAGWSRSERREWADAIIAAVRLAAIPETIEQAWALAEMGLGEVLKEVQGAAWAWKPRSLTEAGAGELERAAGSVGT